MKSLVIINTTPSHVASIEAVLRSQKLWDALPKIRVDSDSVRAAYDVAYDTSLEQDVKNLFAKCLPAVPVEIAVSDPHCEPPKFYSRRSEFEESFLEVVHDLPDMVVASGATKGSRTTRPFIVLVVQLPALGLCLSFYVVWDANSFKTFMKISTRFRLIYVYEFFGFRI